LELASLERTENQIVGSNALGFKAEHRVTNQTFTLEEDFKGNWFVERVAERDLGGSSFSDESS